MLAAALLSGFLMAFLGSMPPTGPIAVLVLSRGVLRKYREAVAVAAGAALPEGVYSALAVFGLSEIFERFPAVEWGARILGVVVLGVLGVTFLRFRHSGEEPAEEGKVAGLRDMSRSFGLGFWISAANPVLIVTWSTSFAMLYSLGGLRFGVFDKVAFGAAVAAGCFTWFWIMTLILRRHSGRFTISFATKVIRGAGLALVAMACFFGGTLVLRARG